MSSFRKIFKGKHTFLPVIHVEGGKQALRNALIAQGEGVDGIFLINHHIPYTSLLECYQRVIEKLPNFWIGLNCLDLGMSAVDYIPKDTAGLWVDNAGLSESGNPIIGAQEFARLRQKSGWRGIYFGGVSFKYQGHVDNVARAAKLAVPFVDVITTSGEGTGIAADVDKIRKMKNAISNHPLAIASGVSPENVAEYMPYTDVFLIATKISDSHTELNPAKVRKLAKALGK